MFSKTLKKCHNFAIFFFLIKNLKDKINFAKKNLNIHKNNFYRKMLTDCLTMVCACWVSVWVMIGWYCWSVPGQWWRAGPGGLTVSSAPLLHFPANLKHNKRPFYPQNKLTITQIFTQKWHIFAQYHTKPPTPILGTNWRVKRSFLPVFLWDIYVGIFVIT